MQNAIAAVVGFVCGTLVGASVMKHKMEERFSLDLDDILDEETAPLLEEIRRLKKVKASTDEPEEEDESEEEINEFEEPLPDGYFNYGGITKTKKPDPMDKPATPQELISQHPQDSDEDTDILEEDPRKGTEEVEMAKLISADKYDEDQAYKKDTLYFYQEDEVLTNSDDEELENSYEYVGECLDKYDFRYSEEPLIHVRNEEMNTDFEVQKVYAAFNPD